MSFATQPMYMQFLYPWDTHHQLALKIYSSLLVHKDCVCVCVLSIIPLCLEEFIRGFDVFSFYHLDQTSFSHVSDTTGLDKQDTWTSPKSSHLSFSRVDKLISKVATFTSLRGQQYRRTLYLLPPMSKYTHTESSYSCETTEG